MRFIIRHITQLHLSNSFRIKKLIPNLLSQLTKSPDIHVAIQTNFHHFPLIGLKPYFRFFNIIRKGSDAVHSLINILENLHTVGTGHQFN